MAGGRLLLATVHNIFLQPAYHPFAATLCAGLHLSRDGSGGKMRVKATGGGAYKFAEVGARCFCSAGSPGALLQPSNNLRIRPGRSTPSRPAPCSGAATSAPSYPTHLLPPQLFKERLGLIIEGEDEMACMVEGCNFLLNAGAALAEGWGCCRGGWTRDAP